MVSLKAHRAQPLHQIRICLVDDGLCQINFHAAHSVYNCHETVEVQQQVAVERHIEAIGQRLLQEARTSIRVGGS
ncbi:MAG: hypothetical protein R2873_16210 [Caldilineaceae bacterium]